LASIAINLVAAACMKIGSLIAGAEDLTKKITRESGNE
jgi:hypothetical protein